MTGREDILCAGITKADKIIEIGPSFNPLAPKSQGWCSYAVDHADREGLISKYRQDPTVNVALIEPVDFVWTGGALSSTVPVEHHGTFDVLLASHVIEHVPDLIGFLRSAEILCRPAARMVLAVPDKRVCFDFFRPLSTTGDVLVAHWERRSRHSSKTLWDYFAYQVTKHGGPGWGRTDQAPMAFGCPFDEAAAWAQKHSSNEYIDAHSWVFVPASFALILLELACRGLTDWHIEHTELAEYTEFYVWLRRGALAKVAAMSEDDRVAERMRLLTETMLDLDDQGRQLTSSRANRLESGLARTKGTVGTLQRVEAEWTARLGELQVELMSAQNTIKVMRSSRAWRARSLLRRLLGLPATAADA